MKMEERLKVFNYILPFPDKHSGLLDGDDGETSYYSCGQLLNFINRVVAKISICRLLLFPNEHHAQLISEKVGNLKQITLEVGSHEESQSRMHFLKCLVDSWQHIVKKFPLVLNGSVKEKNQYNWQLNRYLELFILRTILELTMNMQEFLIQLQSISFLRKMVRASLLCRFEDPITLRMLRNVLTLLSEGSFSYSSYLQLLLAHSQFASSIHSDTRLSSSHIGAFVRPMSSILRSLAYSNSKKGPQTEHCLKQLEIVKLLRILILKLHQIGSEDISVNLKELHLLLLSAYGATLSEIDLEIYNLMREIESIDKTISDEVTEMDYLWGPAAIRIREERALDKDFANNTLDTDTGKEHQRSRFRENLHVDPKICATTALYFPYDRNESDKSLPLSKLQVDNPSDVFEACAPDIENIERYDPVFILRFSIHALTVGYIEPMEFTGLGLLAVAFVSMSSPDLGMRKLGYECLGRYRNALERCLKKKEIMQLRLLLTYLQNGIEEPWQRIPSVTALFAADSSFILLDPSNDYYLSLSKHLLHCSKVNMKRVPLFHSLFQSNSAIIKTEMIWMIRLVYAALNLDDDSQIYISNSVIETLLSFFASPLSDDEAKKLILKIVKKSVKLPRMAQYLVEYCGLFPWLSYVLTIYKGQLDEAQITFSSQHLLMVTEVVTDAISSRNLLEWLRSYALEQLMELVSQLYKLLVDGLKLIRGNSEFTNSVLNIMTSTLKMCQKRKIYQPRLILSFEGLFPIYQSSASATERSSATSGLGLNAILMTTPPVDIFNMSQEKLSSFLLWAVSTAMKSNTGPLLHVQAPNSRTISIEQEFEESLTSKLLRWLVASVILGKLSYKPSYVENRISTNSSPKTLQSFMEYVEGLCGKNKYKNDSEELLAATIFYLQQLLSINSTVLPSAVSALCLILFSDASKPFGGCGTSLMSLYSKIRHPTESNPSWRWSFYQPWKDDSFELTDSEKLEEQHACEALLVMILNTLGKKSLDSKALSSIDIDDFPTFEWERSILLTDSISDT